MSQKITLVLHFISLLEERSLPPNICHNNDILLNLIFSSLHCTFLIWFLGTSCLRLYPYLSIYECILTFFLYQIPSGSVPSILDLDFQV